LRDVDWIDTRSSASISSTNTCYNRLLR